MMQVDKELPRVHILATGGTIAGKADSALNTSHYQAGMVPVTELTSAVPGLADIAEVSAEQVMNVPSSAITPHDLLALVRRVDEIFSTDEGLSGIVITHGTDTMEESAYFAHLLVHHKRPVVFVGAMRPSTALSADGPMNLANAVRVAANVRSRNQGVLVLMNDEVYSARDVTKTNTARLHTFRSPDLGPLGFVDGGEVSYYHSPLKKHTYLSEFQLESLSELPRVDIIYSYTGADRILIEA
ncbi:MAG TPA: asparaginase, partial [Bacillota bacterium]|nr:asparaginase [Bacillota bacterium]